MDDTVNFGDAASVAGRFKKLLQLDIQHVCSSSDGEWPSVVAQCAEQFRTVTANEKKTFSAMRSRLKSIQTQLASLKVTANSLEAKKACLLNQLSAISQPSVSERAVNSEHKELAKLEQTIAFYEQEMMFKLKRVKGTTIMLTFQGFGDTTEISYCKLVELDESGDQLKLLKCHPPVFDIERLVNFLNQTSDFRSFLIVLRRRFKHYFKTRTKKQH